MTLRRIRTSTPRYTGGRTRPDDRNDCPSTARSNPLHAEIRAIRGYIDRIHRRFPATRETTDSDTG